MIEFFTKNTRYEVRMVGGRQVLFSNGQEKGVVTNFRKSDLKVGRQARIDYYKDNKDLWTMVTDGELTEVYER